MDFQSVRKMTDWKSIIHFKNPRIVSGQLPRSPLAERDIFLTPLAGSLGRNGCFEVSTVFDTTAPLLSLPGRKPGRTAVRQDSSCKTFRSGWTSQPGQPRVRSRFLITKRSLVPSKLARGGSKTTEPGKSQLSLKKIVNGLRFVAKPW